MLHNPKWDQQVDLSKPSLPALAYLLRHKELWPSGFEWKYTDCDACAMGLAFQLWQLGEHPDAYKMTEHFPISEWQARKMFTHGFFDYPGSVTPEMVADRLDALTETELSE